MADRKFTLGPPTSVDWSEDPPEKLEALRSNLDAPRAQFDLGRIEQETIACMIFEWERRRDDSEYRKRISAGLMARISTILKAGRPLPDDARLWLANNLSTAAQGALLDAGRPADAAFGFAPGRGNFGDFIGRLDMAAHMHSVMRWMGPRSKTRAAEELALAIGCEDATKLGKVLTETMRDWEIQGPFIEGDDDQLTAGATLQDALSGVNIVVTFTPKGRSIHMRRPLSAGILGAVDMGDSLSAAKVRK